MSILYKALQRQTGGFEPSVAYRPQSLRKAPATAGISQILLPRRRGPFLLMSLLAIAAALAFLPDFEPPAQPKTTLAAHPVVAEPRIDPSIAAVAALLPPTAAATLPLDNVTEQRTTLPPNRTLNITVRKPEPLPDDGSALALQGIKLAQAGDTDGAEAALRASLSHDPRNPLILYNLAVLADRRGDEETARTLYNSTLEALTARPSAGISPQRVADRLDRLDGPPGEDDQ